MMMCRHPRTPVTGYTVLSRSDRRQGVGIIVDIDAVRYKVYWRDAQTLCVGTRATRSQFPASITDNDGHENPHSDQWSD
jgi:hypothetical protein